MEDQRVQSAQTMAIGCKLSSKFWISIEVLTQFPGLQKNKNNNVQYYFEAEFNFWNDW